MHSDVRRAFARAALRLPALFALVFYGADQWAARRATRWSLYFDWELAMPYWPAAYLVYFGVFLMPFAVPWLARDARDVQQWERRMAAAIGVAGALFLLLPAQLGYGPADAGRWEPLVRGAHVVAGRHNLLPSLHVALGLVTLMAAWPNAGRGWRALLLTGFVLQLPAVLLTHQHHVADVLSGAALGWAAGRVGWRRGRVCIP